MNKQRQATTFSYQEIKEELTRIQNKEDQFMLAASYANGTRVSEVVGLKAVDIDWTKEFVYITTPVKKKRGDIVPMRSPPISWEKEPWLCKIIINYAVGKKGRLISYGVRTAQRRFDDWFECTSHSFRHTRATHCFTVLNMSMRMVAEYFRISAATLNDWSLRYGHLNRKDIETHLRSEVKKDGL